MDSEIQERVDKVMQVMAEPMFLSEAARKLDAVDDDMAWSVAQVAQVISTVTRGGDYGDRLEIYDVDYESMTSQSEGSAHYTLSPEGGLEETDEWKNYTVVHNVAIEPDEIDDYIREVIDLTVSVEEKVAQITTVSEGGKEISVNSEKILQDVIERQFRYYDDVEYTEYNDPGLDSVVYDKDNMNFGLAIEITTRFENPVDKPYLDSKLDKAFDRDLNVLVMGPAFTGSVMNQYEQVDDDIWHTGEENSMVHLHRVPHDNPEVYRPFMFQAVDEEDRLTTGYPVIVADDNRTRDRLANGSSVGPEYPVVVDSLDDTIRAMENLGREIRVVTESGYRNMVRQALEPLLPEFRRPYLIEQWLIDTYWDQGMTTSEIGSLAGVSGRTIRRWMGDQHWDIVTRGTRTPISDKKLEIWKRMYRGDDPFEREYTGYEIQYLYNRHPQYTLDDWREWVDKTDAEKARIMSQRFNPSDNYTYTLMVTEGDRLFPSYSFVIEALRREGVEIREGYLGDAGLVAPTQQALEYMLNVGFERLVDDEEPKERDVALMKSGFEVEVAEWFSDNEIGFAYEPFVVPSRYSRSPDDVTDLREIVGPDMDDTLKNEWRRIYQKHSLGDETDITVEQGLERFERQRIEPDFVVYSGEGPGERGPKWDGWSQWDAIVEVAGAYGVGNVDGWDNWYRVQGVAYKELAFKALGLWDDTYFIVNNNDALSDDVRNDPHYVVAQTSQLDAGLDSLMGQLIQYR